MTIERDEPVPMRRALTLKVLPEYVNAYLDEGWTVVESETKGREVDPHDEELGKYKRGAKTLGEIIEKQGRDVLDVTGLHHLINEDGDGHWDVVWMRLFEMRDELASLKESTIGRERQRGDKWRDRAQEMASRVQSLEVELEATKPRTVTTATELDALRSFTVIRSADGVVYEKQTMWHEAGSRDLVYWPAIALPATVLQEGWGEE